MSKPSNLVAIRSSDVRAAEDRAGATDPAPLRELRGRIASLEAALQQSEQQLKLSLEQQAALRGEAAALNQRLQEILASDFWRLAETYYGLRGRAPLKQVHALLQRARHVIRRVRGMEARAQGYNPYADLGLFKPVQVHVLDEDIAPAEVPLAFTALTTVRNEGAHILEFLESIAAQSRQPDELIVVDGGSSDDTVERLREFQARAPFKVVVEEAGPVNIAAGRNRAIALATHETLALIDAGCQLAPNYFANLVGGFVRHPQADLVGGIYHPTHYGPGALPFIPDWSTLDFTQFLPSARAVAVRRSLAQRVGGFPEYLTHTGEDTIFDVLYRQVSSVWVFNRRAAVKWRAPETDSAAQGLAYRYAVGDGESGFGDYRFYPQQRGAVRGDAIHRALVEGYRQGRRNRATIERERRGVRRVVVFLAELPLADVAGADNLETVRRLVQGGSKVIYASARRPSAPRRVQVSFDPGLLELYHLPDLDVEELAERYAGMDEVLVVADTGALRARWVAAQLRQHVRGRFEIISAAQASERTAHEFDQGPRRQLASILESGRPLVAMPPLVDWNIPLHQRYQHMAASLARLGFEYLYGSSNQYDSVQGFEQIEPHLHLTNRFDLVEAVQRPVVFHLYAGDMRTTWEQVERRKRAGHRILYEYVDEISEQILGKVPASALERHRRILADEECIVVASAESLIEEVRRHRTRNTALVTNGVEVEHFSQKFSRAEVPAQLREAVDSGRPIVGYYGALASWFDYPLVRELAGRRPDYQVVLIGWNYDGTLDREGLTGLRNVTVIPPVHYKNLPRYAHWFSVSTIPFVLNDVTRSCSPIKLFEYMALGHPIVTTDLPECRKYQSPRIGRTHDEFIELVDRAIRSPEPQLAEVMRAEALANSWQSKAAQIAALLRASPG